MGGQVGEGSKARDAGAAEKVWTAQAIEQAGYETSVDEVLLRALCQVSTEGYADTRAYQWPTRWPQGATSVPWTEIKVSGPCAKRAAH